jgi:hypothetical protein
LADDVFEDFPPPDPWWCIGQVLAVIVMCLCVYYMSEALHAYQPSAYAARFGSVPPALAGCDAIVPSYKGHRTPHCAVFGSAASNPAGLIALGLIFLVAIAFMLASGKRGRGFLLSDWLEGFKSFWWWRR